MAKQFLKKFANTLLSKELYIYCHLIFLLIISFHLPFVFIIALIWGFLTRKKYNKKILAVIVIFVSIIYYMQATITVPNYIEGEYLVISKVTVNHGYQVIVKNGNYRYLVYTNSDLQIGEYINIAGKVKKFDGQKIPLGFNRAKYYFGQGIYGEIQQPKITESLTKNNQFYYFSNKVFSLSNDQLGIRYFKIFFGYNRVPEEVQNLNFSYLFNISGLHIHFILLVLRAMFQKTILSKKNQTIIEVLVLFFLLIVTNYNISVLRYLIYEIFKAINNASKRKISNYSIMNLSFFAIIILTPYSMFNQSLLIMYLLTNALTLLSPIYENKSLFQKNLITSAVASLILLPFTGKVNFLTLLLSPIQIITIVYGLFPISIITVIFNSKTINFNIIFEMYETIIKILDSKNHIMFTIAKMSSILIVCYYILLIAILYLESNKRIMGIIAIMLIIFVPSFARYWQEPTLYFLDVGQGDSAVYISKDLVIVVDAYKEVENFLISMGIKKIDYLIISHKDSDHSLEAQTLLDNFIVKTVLINSYDDYQLASTNIRKITSEVVITDNEVKMHFLEPMKNASTSNNNSLVFKLTFNNQTVLFTGDIEKEAEEFLTTRYGELLKSDILKIPHHGSSTSTSIDFLDYVNPKYAIISLGRDNNYGFPDEGVINLLDEKKVSTFRTDIGNTIIFRSNNVKYMTDNISKLDNIIV